MIGLHDDDELYALIKIVRSRFHISLTFSLNIYSLFHGSSFEPVSSFTQLRNPLHDDKIVKDFIIHRNKKKSIRITYPVSM